MSQQEEFIRWAIGNDEWRVADREEAMRVAYYAGKESGSGIIPEDIIEVINAAYGMTYSGAGEDRRWLQAAFDQLTSESKSIIKKSHGVSL